MRAVRRNNRRLLAGVFFFSFAATLGFLGVMNQPTTEAASTSGFKAGNIISDYVMKDYNSMTEAQIQSFLKSKVTCNQDSSLAATGAYKYENVSTKANGVSYNRRYYWKKSNGGDTSALYHVASNGKFVCMADESFEGMSAAHIIWDAAQTYKISPKVLIVLLQKEQGLITDSWPNEIQYRAATGYGCPDTAACDAKYYGFYNQVGNAAYLFNAIVYNGKHNLYPVGNNYVRYNPNAACGGSTVKIENVSTGALYTYTPYQPNAGSLAAGYGTTTDGCGAYGNRNFYLYYSDWFGDAHAGGATQQPIKTDTTVGKSTVTIDEGIYAIATVMDGNYTVDVSGASLNEGERIQLWQNNGTIAQKFHIRSADDGYYFIENLNSSKMLMIDQNNNVVQSGYNSKNHKAYIWSISGSQDGIIFTSASSGLSLSVVGKISNGTSLKGQTTNGGTTQKFKLKTIAKSAKTNINNKDVTIASTVTKDGMHVVDVSGAQRYNGTNIHLWSANNTNAQVFKVESLSNGFYRIVASKLSDNKQMVLDVSGAQTINGANVHLWEWNWTIAQQWILVENADKTYSFVSRCNGLALDVAAGDSKNSTNIQIWNQNSTPAQKFLLKNK